MRTTKEFFLCNLLNQNHVLMIHHPDEVCRKPNFVLALIQDNYNSVKTSDNLNKLNTIGKHMRPQYTVLFSKTSDWEDDK